MTKSSTINPEGTVSGISEHELQIPKEMKASESLYPVSLSNSEYIVPELSYFQGFLEIKDSISCFI